MTTNIYIFFKRNINNDILWPILLLLLTDFLSKFENATQGEHFRHPSIKEQNDEVTQKIDTESNDKDDLNAFMDELETFTSGEHFKK
jgi:hypothetical protein